MFKKNTFSMSFWEALFICVLYVLLPFLLTLLAAVAGIPFYGGFSNSFVHIIDFFNLPLSNAILSLVNIIVIILLLRLKKDDVFDIDWVNKVEPVWLVGTVILVLGLSIVVSEIGNIAQYFFPMDPFWIDIFRSVRNQPLAFFIIEVIIVAPFVEEFLFRGIIARGLDKKYSYVFAIIVSSFMFGLVHLNFWQFVSAFSAGIFITWLYLYTRSLLLVIFAHGLFNGIDLLFTRVLSISIPGFNEVGTNFYSGQPYLFTLLGVVLLIVGTIIIKSIPNNNPVEY
ncbi:MAG: CPBP family intramembrane glutamic endopeptidase [Clostridia bacterium]